MGNLKNRIYAMIAILKDYYYLIFSNAALKGAALIVASIISAKLIDVIFTFIVKKMVKTNFI